MIDGEIRLGDPGQDMNWLAWWLNALGAVLGLWVVFAPNPVLLMLTIAAPVLAIIRLGVRVDALDKADLSYSWIMPCLGLLLYGLHQELSDPFAAYPVVFLPALAHFAAVIWLDPAARRWTLAPVIAIVAFCWAWGGLVGINVALDRSPAQIVTAEVIEAEKVSRGGHQLTIRTTRGVDEIFHHVTVAKALFDKHPQGMPICLAFHDGALGWRHFAAIDCPAGAVSLN